MTSGEIAYLQSRYRINDSDIPSAVKESKVMRSATSVTYLGHSTVLIEMNGVRLLTDPLLRKYVGPLHRQFPLPEPDVLDVDGVLISHLHGDHFDLPSLKKLDKDTPLLVPRGAGPYLKMRRFHSVEEVEEGETIQIGGLRVSATPAVHEGRNLPWTPLVEPLGYLIEGSHEIYFAGDTDLFPEMTSIGKKLDLALLPVWGWGPNLGKGHMDPLRAAQALTHLRPKNAIPIHWGTYSPIGLSVFRPRFLSQPPLEFAKHAEKEAPDVNVHILSPGHSFSLTGGGVTSPDSQ